MGLDTTHGCWHGAYSIFDGWRAAVRDAAAISAGEGSVITLSDVPEGETPSGVVKGVWIKPPDEPLLVLLLHSDCDGDIPNELCQPLADRLRQLVADEAFAEEWAAERAEQFAAGLERAASAGEDVGFW